MNTHMTGEENVHQTFFLILAMLAQWLHGVEMSACYLSCHFDLVFNILDRLPPCFVHVRHTSWHEDERKDGSGVGEFPAQRKDTRSGASLKNPPRL